MAQLFTRNVKDLTTEQVHSKTIKEFTNVNDLVSNKKHNYIKKPDETMHCLTDNLKTLTSENELLTVVNDNENNKSTLTVNHDNTKENLLKSTDNSVKITRNDDKTDLSIVEYHDSTKENLLKSTDGTVIFTRDNTSTNLSIPKPTSTILQYNRVGGEVNNKALKLVIDDINKIIHLFFYDSTARVSIEYSLSSGLNPQSINDTWYATKSFENGELITLTFSGNKITVNLSRLRTFVNKGQTLSIYDTTKDYTILLHNLFIV